MERAAAIAAWGADGFSQCAELPCTPGRAATGVSPERYCFRPRASVSTISTIAFQTLTPTPTPVLGEPPQAPEDGDGIPFPTDNCPFVANADQWDHDGDGAGDACDNCEMATNKDQKDSDGDRIGDACDLCRMSKDPAVNGNTDDMDAPGYEDADGDRIGDRCDTCPKTKNPDQADRDGDSVGDACDLCPDKKGYYAKYDDKDSPDAEDFDTDGTGDDCDNCWSVANPDQADSDLGEKVCTSLPSQSAGGEKTCYRKPAPDGKGDACDNCPAVSNGDQKDADGDKAGNACDNCPTVKNEDQLDTNHDGEGDACDCNDGITGPFEIGPDDGVLCPPVTQCQYCGQFVKPIYLARSPEQAIDIVFVPSKTTWDVDSDVCRSEDQYPKNESDFRKVAQDAIANWYWEMDTFSANSIPADYRHRMNFYYYWRPGKPADMCGSCAGDLPDTFWTDAYFADVGAILYPPKGYGKEYAGGCADMLGPSKSHFKAPGYVSWGKVILHESGHAVFALVDTYCGDTHYEQNDPFTNVWSSETACKNDLKSKGGDQTKCRQILYDDPGTVKNPDCTKDFWKWDPDPDLMNDHFGGNFGPRDVAKINYIFQTWTGA
jgi:hypothetical protein